MNSDRGENVRIKVVRQIFSFRGQFTTVRSSCETFSTTIREWGRRISHRRNAALWGVSTRKANAEIISRLYSSACAVGRFEVSDIRSAPIHNEQNVVFAAKFLRFSDKIMI